MSADTRQRRRRRRRLALGVVGALIVREHGDLERDLPSRALLRILGPDNDRPIEYRLFYADIRENAAARVAAFVGEAR